MAKIKVKAMTNVIEEKMEYEVGAEFEIDEKRAKALGSAVKIVGRKSVDAAPKDKQVKKAKKKK